MLKCVLFMDMEAIRIWKDIPKNPGESKNAELVFSK